MSVLENGQQLGVCHDELTCIFRTSVLGLGLQLIGLNVVPKLLGNFGPGSSVAPKKEAKSLLSFTGLLSPFGSAI